MGNLCMRAGHGHHHNATLAQPAHSRGGGPAGHSNADASYAPAVATRSGAGPTRAEVKRQRDAAPHARDLGEGSYPPPAQPALRRRSSVKRELAATDAALLKTGEADYPPPQVATGKSRRRVKAERDRGGALAGANQDF